MKILAQLFYFNGYTASNDILSNFQAVNGSVSSYHGTHTSYRPLAPNPTQSQDIFLGRFSGTNFIPDWFSYYGSNTAVKSNQNNDIGYGLALDNSGNIYLVGSTLSLDFEIPNSNPIQPTLVFGQEGSIIKFGCTSGLREGNFSNENISNANPTEIMAYPNPFNSSLKVVVPENDHYILELYDGKGNLMIQQTIISNQTEINLAYLSSGLYNLRLINGSKTTSIKVVKIE